MSQLLDSYFKTYFQPVWLYTFLLFHIIYKFSITTVGERKLSSQTFGEKQSVLIAFLAFHASPRQFVAQVDNTAQKRAVPTAFVAPKCLLHDI